VEGALKDGNQAVVADLDASEILEPGVGAFDFPAFAVSAQLAFVFEAAMTVVAAVGSDQLCAALFQPFAQRIGVLSAICNHASETGTGASRATAGHLHRSERAFCKPVFGNLRGREWRSDRYATVVDHHHALRTFPATCCADGKAPFWAVTKVASRKASSHPSSLRSSNWPSRLRHALSQTPCSSHIRSRCQQVDPSGSCSGKSRHRAPVRRTQSMPSRQARLQAQGRPRPSRRRFGSGNHEANIIHCSSLNYTGRCFIEEAQPPLLLIRKSLP